MSRTYAITGGYGLLGQAVARAVLAAGGRAALIDFAPEGRGLPGGVVAIGGVDLSDEVQDRSCGSPGTPTRLWSSVIASSACGCAMEIGPQFSKVFSRQACASRSARRAL